MEIKNYILCHHLNVKYNGDECMREKLSIWDNFYKNLQDVSKHKVNDPVVEIAAYSKTKSFAVFVTGRDLFLAVYNINNNSLVNVADAEDILSVKTSKTLELYRRLIKIRNNYEKQESPNELLALWGSYIPKVRNEESFLSRLPQNIIIERTNTPFELHLINPYNNNMRCIADFEKSHIRSSKTTEQFYGAFKKCIEDVYHGKDLSGQKARSAVARYAVNNIENDTTTLSKAQAQILISEGKSMVSEQTQKIERI